MLQLSPLTGRAHGILRPAQKHRDLGDVERLRAVLEHLWNTTVVNRWGRVVRKLLRRRSGTRMVWLGW